jgi:hypothetical protein
MASLAAFKRSIKPGSTILCVENTYQPKLNGKKRVVVRVRGNAFVSHREGIEGDFFTYWPKARDVVAVSETEITFRLFAHSGDYALQHHTVTLRLEPA